MGTTGWAMTCLQCISYSWESRRIARSWAVARPVQPGRHVASDQNQTNIVEARAKAADSNRRIAAAFAANVLPVIRQIDASGVTGHKAIAAALGARGIRGGTAMADAA